MKNSKLFKPQFVVIALATVFISLSYQNCSQLGSEQSSKSANGSYSGLSEQEILYRNSSKVLNDKCVACHNSAMMSGSVDLTSANEMLRSGVVVPNEPALSPLMMVLQDTSIEAHISLKQTEINHISVWIAEGFKSENNSGLPTFETIPLGPNWKSIQSNIISRRCTGCHNSFMMAGGVSFQTFAGVRSRITPNDPTGSLLYRRVAGLQGARMPQAPNVPLSGDEINAISQWIAAGALEN